ncbi:MAG: DegT/DnrJ/EryC1/StrS family aminotransferase [Bifidobacteriaceae bacterium]|jgi:dTDP-4-amino-4,6-dideoxygalactose transaminase|nr:DegT/DnrJ/EryC1/StrS family aminotransferase [Bifidobacteriaceae bacterium]
MTQTYTNDQNAGARYARELKERLAQRTGTRAEEWFPVFKARYGMREVFDAVTTVHGRGNVVTQLFTCSTAIDPITSARLTPRYAEIDADTVSVDPSAARKLASPDLRAVVMQHTFGIIDSAQASRLRTLCDATNALLMEDSAHCVARLARDDEGRPLADVSIHSFGIEKMTPTHFGGAVWVNPKMRDTKLRERILRALSDLDVIGARLKFVTRIYFTQNRILAHLPSSVSRPLRHFFVQHGLMEPAIVPLEQKGGLPYASLQPSEWINHEAVKGLAGLDSSMTARRNAVALYLSELAGVTDAGKLSIPSAVTASDPLLRFPLFVRDEATAQRVLAEVRKAGWFAEPWYRPALFPGSLDDAANGIDEAAKTPVSTRLIAGAVALPTDLDTAATKKICQIVIRSL